MTLRSLSAWLECARRCHSKKKTSTKGFLVWQWGGTWLQWYTSPMLSCDFSHIPAPLRRTPTHPHQPLTPDSLPTPTQPNTSLPAKYVGRRVIQGERGPGPCRESQWDLGLCPSHNAAAPQYSSSSLLPPLAIVGSPFYNSWVLIVCVTCLTSHTKGGICMFGDSLSSLSSSCWEEMFSKVFRPFFHFNWFQVMSWLVSFMKHCVSGRIEHIPVLTIQTVLYLKALFISGLLAHT